MARFEVGRSRVAGPEVDDPERPVHFTEYAPRRAANGSPDVARPAQTREAVAPAKREERKARFAAVPRPLEPALAADAPRPDAPAEPSSVASGPIALSGQPTSSAGDGDSTGLVGGEGGRRGAVGGDGVDFDADLVPPQPKATNQPPEYPREMRHEGRVGSVTLRVLIDARGRVAEVVRLAGDEPFVTAAIESVRTWRYDPATRNGEPLAAFRLVKFEFRLTEA